MFGLYIHIPFCRHICHYCDFYKMVVSDKLKEKVIDNIIKEMVIRNIKQYNVETIYIGGGTPSILPYYLLDKLLSSIEEHVNIDNIKEYTIELNPEDINDELIQLISKHHITRVSIGIQSFNQNIIDRLGRIPFVSEQEIKNKIELLNRFGINNINLDLIYAVPGETLEIVKEDLEIITKLNITHVSTYSLILEEHTVFDYLLSHGKLELVHEDDDYQMYMLIRKTLEENGFKQYEVSNFSKEGFNSKHNLNYWYNGEYLGIGPSGSSHINNNRFTNIKNLSKYFDGINNSHMIYDEDIMLSIDDIYVDEVMLGLRLTKGISITDFEEKYNKSVFDVFPKIKSLIDEGLLEIEEGCLRIPLKHTYISNYILVKIFE